MRGYNKQGGGGQAVPFSTYNHVPKLKLLLFSYNILSLEMRPILLA